MSTEYPDPEFSTRAYEMLLNARELDPFADVALAGALIEIGASAGLPDRLREGLAAVTGILLHRAERATGEAAAELIARAKTR